MQTLIALSAFALLFIGIAILLYIASWSWWSTRGISNDEIRARQDAARAKLTEQERLEKGPGR